MARLKQKELALNGVLQSLGLSEQEAVFYQTLLPLGDISFADLANAAHVHPQIVVRTVEKLLAKGLVTVSVRRHRKHVRAEDPHVLERLQRERLQMVQEALPSLLQLQKESKDAFVRLARGVDAVRSLRQRGYEELLAGGTYYIISGSGDAFYRAMGDKYEAIEKIRIHKKIKKNIITFESQRSMLQKREKGLAYVSMRYLPPDFPIPSSTNIFNDTVALIIWTPDPIVITIESKEVALSHKQTFDVLWSMGKK